ncbi:MAG: sulfatase [Gemmatimonadota bacterium]
MRAYLLILGALLLTASAALVWPPARRRLAGWPLPAEGAERPGRVLRAGLWFALVTALLEMIIRHVQLVAGERFNDVGPHAWWTIPLADSVIFLIPATLFAAAARLGWPRLGSLRAVLFTLGSLAAVALLYLFHPDLHLSVIPILAAGLAAVLTRAATARPARFHALVGRTVLPLMLFLSLLALGMVGSGWAAERRARGALPAPPAGAPNVLLIVLDTVRAANLSLYGYARETTPGLDRLARRGVVFEQAYATAPWTLPSHASLFTGRMPHDLSVEVNQGLDGTHPTLAERFRAAGYASGGFVANRFYAGVHTGLARGFEHYDAAHLSPGEVMLSAALGRLAHRSVTLRSRWRDAGRKYAPAVTAEFLAWRDGVADRPWFAFLNYYDAHVDYHSAPPFDHAFPDPPPPGPQRRALRIELDAYDRAIAYLDGELGRLLAALDRRGDLSDTIVVITSDHGEAFGEHGLQGHGNDLYRPVLHVPLLIVHQPRVSAGRRIGEPVSLRDVPATILDLAGLGDALLPGQSLAWAWRGGAFRTAASAVHADMTGRRWLPARYPVSKGHMRALVTERFHFIRNGDGSEELYDYRRDPWEQTDLAETPEGTGARLALRAALRRQEAGS